MTARAKEALRWSVIVGSGGTVCYVLAGFLLPLFKAPSPGWMSVVAFAFVLLLCSPLLLIAYCFWRREYYELVSVLNGLGAVLVYLALNTLAVKFFLPKGNNFAEISPGYWQGIFQFTLPLIAILTPFLIARWCYRLISRQITRWFLPRREHSSNAAPMV